MSDNNFATLTHSFNALTRSSLNHAVAMSSFNRRSRVTYSCCDILCVCAVIPAVVFSNSANRASTPASPLALVDMISNAMDT